MNCFATSSIAALKSTQDALVVLESLSLYLFSGNAHVISDVREDCRLNEEPFQAQSFASTLQLGPFGNADLDELQHTALMLSADLWRWRTDLLPYDRKNEQYMKFTEQMIEKPITASDSVLLTCGPCSVMGSKGLPTILLFALSTLLRTNSSYMGSST